MKSPVVKRSIVVAGHKTSVSLEEAFWNGMKEISGVRDMTLSELVGEIDTGDAMSSFGEFDRVPTVAARNIQHLGLGRQPKVLFEPVHFGDGELLRDDPVPKFDSRALKERFKPLRLQGSSPVTNGRCEQTHVCCNRVQATFGYRGAMVTGKLRVYAFS